MSLDSADPFSRISTISPTKKKKSRNKRKFSDDQIRSLESIFHCESRLEPQKKLQIATDLGLHPRQVAIWFQNKRARWRSKHIEQEYNVLQANYSTLAARFESLKKEKQTLFLQLQKLNDLLQKSQGERQTCREIPGTGDTTTSEAEKNQSSLLEISEPGLGSLSDEDFCRKAADQYFELKDKPDELLVEPADSCLTLVKEDWARFDNDGLFKQSSSSYQWWDFWS